MIEEPRSGLESLLRVSLPAVHVDPGVISLIELERIIPLVVWTVDNSGFPLDITLQGLRGSE